MILIELLATCIMDESYPLNNMFVTLYSVEFLSYLCFGFVCISTLISAYIMLNTECDLATVTPWN